MSHLSHRDRFDAPARALQKVIIGRAGNATCGLFVSATRDSYLSLRSLGLYECLPLHPLYTYCSPSFFIRIKSPLLAIWKTFLSRIRTFYPQFLPRNWSIQYEGIVDGVQKYGSRAAWEDPTDWVISSCPWKDKMGVELESSLLRIRMEDVGCDGPAVSVSALNSTAAHAKGELTPEAAESLVSILN